MKSMKKQAIHTWAYTSTQPNTYFKSKTFVVVNVSLNQLLNHKV